MRTMRVKHDFYCRFEMQTEFGKTSNDLGNIVGLEEYKLQR